VAIPSQIRAWSTPDLSGATLLSRELALALPAEAAWQMLRSIETVVGCVPGVALARIVGDEAEGSLSVAIGPMRAVFRGRARVSYDDAAQSGTLTGGAADAARSAALGALTFRVSAQSAEHCTVHTDIRYRLSGPLAQVGRPVIVADMVDTMLGRFNANLLAAAAGRAADTRPLGGVRLMVALLLKALRRLRN
jgi:carbon-monoxide dehydrogenase small subunit